MHLFYGKRLDSYIPGKEIVSRKATSLDKIKTATFEKYLKELTTKYKKGMIIKSNKYSKKPFNINGQKLSGEYFLEIPLSNKAVYESSKTLKGLAKKYDVTIKYLAE